jgi:ribonuclease HII
VNAIAVRSDSTVFGSRAIAGVDEVGRGALAGPVIAAAVVLDPDRALPSGLDDSKRLSPLRREELAVTIRQTAQAWSIARAEASEVDSVNVLQASLLAMRRTLVGLRIKPEWIRVDGNQFPWPDLDGEAVVRGDSRYPEIMAASILAKVWRDREMVLLDLAYPGYGFRSHKGYPTAMHRDMLRRRGVCPAHRLTFGPVSGRS